jgi:hypothetical protein
MSDDEIEDRRGMEIATAIVGTLLLGVVALAALVVL